MNYRHAFHAGNHGDVLKHVVLLGLCDALARKPAPLFALDTHAGRGAYALSGDEAARTGESADGFAKLAAAAPPEPLLERYLAAVSACRAELGADAYPGSPWLLAHALRGQDRISCCELQEEEAAALKARFRHDPRVAVHQRDGYAAIRALLPPVVDGTRFARGLVLVDPPYEAQLAEFDIALKGLREGLQRWPQACFALWYPIKQRRLLRPFLRSVPHLPAKSALLAELLVRADDSPLRMNGSGMLLLNVPWQLDAALAPALGALHDVLGGPGAPAARLEWLKEPE
jgi:23S rRNA (adenine2030-N6)-methyltransferase